MISNNYTIARNNNMNFKGLGLSSSKKIVAELANTDVNISVGPCASKKTLLGVFNSVLGSLKNKFGEIQEAHKTAKMMETAIKPDDSNLLEGLYRDGFVNVPNNSIVKTVDGLKTIKAGEIVVPSKNGELEIVSKADFLEQNPALKTEVPMIFDYENYQRLLSGQNIEKVSEDELTRLQNVTKTNTLYLWDEDISSKKLPKDFTGCIHDSAHYSDYLYDAYFIKGKLVLATVNDEPGWNELFNKNMHDKLNMPGLS